MNSVPYRRLRTRYFADWQSPASWMTHTNQLERRADWAQAELCLLDSASRTHCSILLQHPQHANVWLVLSDLGAFGYEPKDRLISFSCTVFDWRHCVVRQMRMPYACMDDTLGFWQCIDDKLRLWLSAVDVAQACSGDIQDLCTRDLVALQRWWPDVDGLAWRSVSEHACLQRPDEARSPSQLCQFTEQRMHAHASHALGLITFALEQMPAHWLRLMRARPTLPFDVLARAVAFGSCSTGVSQRQIQRVLWVEPVPVLKAMFSRGFQLQASALTQRLKGVMRCGDVGRALGMPRWLRKQAWSKRSVLFDMDSDFAEWLNLIRMLASRGYVAAERLNHDLRAWGLVRTYLHFNVKEFEILLRISRMSGLLVCQPDALHTLAQWLNEAYMNYFERARGRLAALRAIEHLLSVASTTRERRVMFADLLWAHPYWLPDWDWLKRVLGIRSLPLLDELLARQPRVPFIRSLPAGISINSLRSTVAVLLAGRRVGSELARHTRLIQNLCQPTAYYEITRDDVVIGVVTVSSPLSRGENCLHYTVSVLGDPHEHAKTAASLQSLAESLASMLRISGEWGRYEEAHTQLLPRCMMLHAAYDYVWEDANFSVGRLQRQFRIGYSAAAKLCRDIERFYFLPDHWYVTDSSSC